MQNYFADFLAGLAAAGLAFALVAVGFFTGAFLTGAFLTSVFLAGALAFGAAFLAGASTTPAPSTTAVKVGTSTGASILYGAALTASTLSSTFATGAGLPKMNSLIALNIVISLKLISMYII
jgi:hypothetical protein